MRFFPFCLLLLAYFATSAVHTQSISPYLHVDQFGYQSLARKVAVISDPQSGFNANDSYTPGNSLDIRNQNNVTVWSGSPTLWNSGNTDPQNGDRGWWLDFSDFTTPGEYYLFDPSTGQQSATFSIGDQVYEDLLKDAGRMFYYNRCNQAKEAPYAESNWVDASNNFVGNLQDTDCSYVYDPENAALRRDLSGGWFDAGDYNKYVSFAESTIHGLLWAYRDSPGAFNDDWNIPESGNGISDLLDEIKWEIDWLYKMTNADGSVINKMGSISFNDNSAAPPSANSDRRYYGPTCTSASIAAASMLAHAAQVMSNIPAWSSDVLLWSARAEACFTYWENARNNNALETDCDDGTIKAGDADRDIPAQEEMALTAAVHLYELTGSSTYLTYFNTYYTEAEMMETGFWGPYKEELGSAMLLYSTLSGADASVSNVIINSFTTAATNNWDGFYGTLDNSLYQSFMPDWSFHWGSNSIINRYANLNRLLVNYGINPGNHTAYRNKAASVLHYMHGVNPQGMVYLSGMEGRGADRGIQEIYHTWFNEGTDWDNSTTSLYGPAPGYVSGGPNGSFTVGSISPPSNQPLMKSYKDWNTGWNGSFSENSWEITEPAIYYQAAYLRNLAAQITTDMVLPVEYAGGLRGQARATDVRLSWQTITEINADYFEIQHLNLRDEWIFIGRLPSNGGGGYQFNHEQPHSGVNNYRLKQVDVDGSFSYSNIASVNFRSLYDDIVVFPNPVGPDQIVELRNLPDGLIVRLFDMSGKLLNTVSPLGAQVSIDLNDLPQGTYLIELVARSGEAVWQDRVIKLD